jgi:hypothetical protein
MYTVKNFKSKKALREAVAAGEQVDTYQPGGFFPAERNGVVHLEGPHYPQAHTWYVQATVVDGIVKMGSVK